MSGITERKRFWAITGLIGSGHGLSHFYFLCLPPLFPLLKEEFGVSYAALGLLITLMNLMTAIFQVPSGMLVDRYGAQLILIGGLVLAGVGIGLIGFAGSYWMMIVLVIVSGLGNSVFHPADYAILTTSIDRKVLGRAFGLHTFTGNIGFMTAPVVMVLLATWMGWRGAMITVGLASIAVVIPLVLYGTVLRDEVSVEPEHNGASGDPVPDRTGLKLYLNGPVMMFFMFFMTIGMVSTGVQTFSVTTLVQLHGLGLGAANTVLTVFLVATAAGVLLGGPLADWTSRHALVASLAMVIGAAVFFTVNAAVLPYMATAALFLIAGVALGTVRPARDMMVRDMTPKGATGRVFAFVSTGLNLGSATTPILLGYLIDLGYANAVFAVVGVILLLSVATVTLVQNRTGQALAPQLAEAGSGEPPAE